MFWRALAVLVGFLAIGAWLTPLRLVTGMANLEANGIAASGIRGTVWNGQLDDLTLHGARLGDFNLATEPFSLLTGAPKLAFRSNGPIVEGAVIAASAGPRFEGLRGQVALTQLDRRAPSGAVATFYDLDIDLAPTACRAATGEARIVGMAAAGLPDMSGPVSCQQGRLVLSLAPDGAQPGPTIDFLIDIENPTAPRLLARTDDPGVQMALPGYGVVVIAP